MYKETELSTSTAARAPRPTRAQRREQLLGAALDGFVDAGYHATAMDHIAERAGVSKPVLYQHFHSKLDLYLGLVDRQATHLIELVEGALGSTEDNAQRVAATVGAYFEFVDREDGGYRLIFQSDQASEPAVRERLEWCVDACAGAIARTIEQDTAMHPTQAQLLGVSLIGMAQSCAERWVAQGRTVTRERAAEMIAQVAWRGLGGLPLTRTEASAFVGRSSGQDTGAGGPSSSHERNP